MMTFKAAAAVLLLAGLGACGSPGAEDGTDSAGLGCEVTRPAESRFLPFGRRAQGDSPVATPRTGDLRDDVPEGWRC